MESEKYYIHAHFIISQVLNQQIIVWSSCDCKKNSSKLAIHRLVTKEFSIMGDLAYA